MDKRVTKKTMPETMYRASRCCRLLGNPTAYLVMRSLGQGRKSPGLLAVELGVSRPAVSLTLRHLRNVDLVRHETVGANKEYWVKDPAVLKILDTLEAWVEHLRVKQV